MSASAANLYRSFLLDLWHAPNQNERLALARSLVSADFVIRRRGGESEDRGPEAIVRLIEQSVQLFDDIRVTLDVGPIADDAASADGTLVAGLWTFHGSFRGGMPGTTAEPGTRVAFSGTDIVRVAEGLIREYWVTADGDHLMSQL